MPFSFQDMRKPLWWSKEWSWEREHQNNAKQNLDLSLSGQKLKRLVCYVSITAIMEGSVPHLF